MFLSVPLAVPLAVRLSVSLSACQLFGRPPPPTALQLQEPINTVRTNPPPPRMTVEG